jgi:hypothetical protein
LPQGIVQGIDELVRERGASTAVPATGDAGLLNGEWV